MSEELLQPRFERAHGITASEALLARLADRSFLSLWSYPNVFKEPNRELTDLLVVFGDDVVLFSDKACAYPVNDPEELAWHRWYKRAIAKSAAQIHQAERWVRSRPRQVFLDVRCETPLPVALPPPDRLRLHRVCVATGAAAHRRVTVGQPSLAIDPTVTGDAVPMRIGRVAEVDGWLHVFDESSLDTIFGELDTAPDFLAYLSAKQALADGRQWQGAESELDVLATYLWNGRRFPQQEGPYRFEPNLWERVAGDRAFRNGKQANLVSYLWDGLIEKVTGLFTQGRLAFGNTMPLADYEIMMRRMATEDRFRRRILARAIVERAERAPREGWIASLLPSLDAETLYVLLMGPGPARGVNYEDYRAYRLDELRLRCHAAKAAQPDKRYIVGIGLDAAGVAPSSEDFAYLDTTEWTIEAVAQAEEIRVERGYFNAATREQRVLDDEYPDGQ